MPREEPPRKWEKKNNDSADVRAPLSCNAPSTA
jgi:hypothetical protein